MRGPPTPITTASLRGRKPGLWLAFAVSAVVCASTGCMSTQAAALRSTPRNPLEPILHLTSFSGPQPSERTQQTLRQFNLTQDFARDPQLTLSQLVVIHREQPREDVCYALAELSYVSAAKLEQSRKKESRDLYWNCVAYAYEYLFDSRLRPIRNPYDPHFRRACDLYNGGLEKCLRLSQSNGEFKPGEKCKITTSSGEMELAITCRGSAWHKEHFDRFEFTSDYEVQGLTNQYRTYGLGVPLIAVRNEGEYTTAEERFYPKRLSFAVTAFLRLHMAREGHAARAELELLDPLETNSITVDDLTVPLESDLTTPLAYFLSNPHLQQLATSGLLRVDQVKPLTGLHMLQPYQPGKAPVVMVHGLWSSPMTWMEMFNDLRAMPEIRQNYQFWFFLYPTGQPYWISAAELRQSLANMRDSFDPQHQDPALDHTVLVGHSMGGLISRLNAIDSGDAFWRTASNRSFEELKAPPELKEHVRGLFFFNASRSVRRVVSIATPFRGSDYSNKFTQLVARNLITFPTGLEEARLQLLNNNRDLFLDPQMLQSKKTSVDYLAPNSPILDALRNAPRPPWVQYHNIVAVDNDGPLETATDGYVPYSSSHLSDSSSEIVVRSDHLNAHRHPLTILEVRRILLDQLRQAEEERRQASLPAPPPVELVPRPRPGQQVLPPYPAPLGPPTILGPPPGAPIGAPAMPLVNPFSAAMG